MCSEESVSKICCVFMSGDEPIDNVMIQCKGVGACPTTDVV